VDFPAATFYRQLAAYYPESNVVLTVRDPERWFQSFSDTIMNGLAGPMSEKFAAWRAMAQQVIVEWVFKGNVLDKAHVIECYRRHNDEVQRTIPRERLLVYDVAQGWKPLCNFLGVDIPDNPFPKVNTTDEFTERFAARMQQKNLS
jgi:Sulfotransferase domain